MAGIYKAYDIRGIYPSEINETIARQAGQAFRAVLDDEDFAHGGDKVVVSRDMRPSSGPLAAALVEGLTAAGLDVLDIGLSTTSMNYFAIGRLGTAGGVQVTASHNPAQYNGLKFSRHEARPVSGDHGIQKLARMIQPAGCMAQFQHGLADSKYILSRHQPAEEQVALIGHDRAQLGGAGIRAGFNEGQ